MRGQSKYLNPVYFTSLSPYVVLWTVIDDMLAHIFEILKMTSERYTAN